MDRSYEQTLLIAGALLFLIGLLSGLAVQLMENPRMGLSAHLAGVQNARATPLAGAGFQGAAFQEALVDLLLSASSGAVIVLIGFWRGRQVAQAPNN